MTCSCPLWNDKGCMCHPILPCDVPYHIIYTIYTSQSVIYAHNTAVADGPPLPGWDINHPQVTTPKDIRRAKYPSKITTELGLCLRIRS